jgi:hypothetical protein
MKVGVIIPDRNDRPIFLDHCLKMMEGQTLKPDFVELVNYEPKSDLTDLTERVRIGFERLKDKCDCVLIIENDDYYSSDYIATMVNEWVKWGKPDLIGNAETIYYHIFKKQFKFLNHPNRASLFQTLISCEANIEWCDDSEVFLDLHLWKKHKGKTFTTEECIAMGIKHGIGKCGGSGHERMIYDFNDPAMNFLRENIEKESFNFYSTL